jgi:hypothetical protein
MGIKKAIIRHTLWEKQSKYFADLSDYEKQKIAKEMGCSVDIVESTLNDLKKEQRFKPNPHREKLANVQEPYVNEWKRSDLEWWIGDIKEYKELPWFGYAGWVIYAIVSAISLGVIAAFLAVIAFIAVFLPIYLPRALRDIFKELFVIEDRHPTRGRDS